jgi:hypothetical protein
MELKDPHTKLFYCSVMLIVALVLLINALQKEINYLSFDDWLDSQLLLSSALTLSFTVQTWKAYQRDETLTSKVITVKSCKKVLWKIAFYANL